MNRLKYSYLAILFFLVLSCKNDQKDAIENKIRQIKGIVALFQDHIDKRNTAISNMSTLDSAKKREYHYDSLVHVQQLQMKSVKIFQVQIDSLKEVLRTLK